MGIVAQGQTEMAKVLRAVIGLRHGPQGRDVHQLVKFRALGRRQQLVQMRGLQNLPLGQREPRALGHFAQAFQLFGAGFFVHAKQQGLFQPLQFLGGGDIGQNHELLDQLMRIKARAIGDRGDAAVLAQDDLAFGQIKVQRLARGAGGFQRRIGRI